MKILFITDLYPMKSEEQTTPKTLHNFVKFWQTQGHRVDVIKPNFLFNSFIRKKPFYKTGKYGDIYNVNYFLPFWGNVKDKLPDLSGYDVCVAHMPSGILLAEKIDLPLVCGIHCSDIEVLTNPIYKIFKPRMEKAFEKAKGIACRSDVLKRKFLKLYPQFEEKTFTCPSGVELGEVPSLNLPDENNLKIVTCANFKKRKNIDKLIQAVNNLENVSLTVIGEGKIKKKWEKLISSKSQINFVGRKNSKEVREIFRNSDIFILPSVGETFGMVYLEAMAEGCITVCTKNDGIDGIIKDGENGFLCEPNAESVEDVIKYIKKLTPSVYGKILKNSYDTVKGYEASVCNNNYLQNILKII